MDNVNTHADCGDFFGMLPRRLVADEIALYERYVAQGIALGKERGGLRKDRKLVRAIMGNKRTLDDLRRHRDAGHLYADDL